MKIGWKYVTLFIFLVLGISYPIQQGYFNDFFRSISRNSFVSESPYLLAGCSTLIAAIIVLMLHKNCSNKITLLGENKLKNLLILSLPIIAFSISGLENDFDMNKWLYGFVFAMINTGYAFTEEFGWRRYLQNALEGLNKNLKYIFISVVWWIWHFRFATSFDLYIFPLICLGGGFLLGKLTDDVKSILPAVAMHTVIILTTNSGSFDHHKIIGIGIVVVGWIIIEQLWKIKNIS